MVGTSEMDKTTGQCQRRAHVSDSVTGDLNGRVEWELGNKVMKWQIVSFSANLTL